MFRGPTAGESMSVTIVSGIRAYLTPIATIGTGTRKVGATTTAIRPRATTTRVPAMRIGNRSRVARRGRVSEVTIPTAPLTAVQLAAAMGENPLCSRSTLGSHPASPCAMKKKPRARTRTVRTRGSASSDRRPSDPSPGAGIAAVGGFRRVTTSQAVTATSMAADSNATVNRHDPVSGMNTEFDRTRVAMPPRTGAVLYAPTANLRSCSSLNQVLTTLGAPAEINGPPMPNRAIADQNPTRPPAEALARPLARMTRAPIARDRRSPSRSTTRPAGGAVAM